MTNINLNAEEKEKNQKNDTPDAFNVKFLKTGVDNRLVLSYNFVR